MGGCEDWSGWQVWVLGDGLPNANDSVVSAFAFRSVDIHKSSNRQDQKVKPTHNIQPDVDGASLT
jgi:hypothetical protein